MAYARRKLNRLKRNRKGGIEGLPMELMIIVVVATIGTGILVGWMGDIEAPQAIGDVSCSVDQITMTSNTVTNQRLEFTVSDTSGNAVKGATVVLTGCGISAYGKTTSGTVSSVTDQNGKATFSGLSLTKTTAGLGYVNVQVTSPEYGEYNTVKIPVVR